MFLVITLCHLQTEAHKYSSLRFLVYGAFTFDGVISFLVKENFMHLGSS